MLFATPFAVFLIPIVAVVAFFIFRTVEAVAKATSDAQKHRSDNELKMTLAQNGMSAAEIERVIAAKPGMNRADLESDPQTPFPGSPLPPHKNASHKNASHFQTGTHSYP